jgi:outer membrane autotransporter protein
MKTGLYRSVAGKLLRGASSLALLVACGAASQALSATYYVASEAQLRNAINSANASADASSKIVFTGNITIIGASVLPNPSKPIEIDTQGFNLRNIQNGAGIGHTNGEMLTLTGTYWGQSVGGSGTIGFNQTSTTTASVIVNNGSIIGGPAVGAGTAGAAVSLAGLTAFTNNGTITGGTSSNANIGGAGAIVRNGSSMINYGTIQGGSNSSAGGGGAGIDLGGAGALATLTNHGNISGGSGSANGSPGSAGGIAVHVRAGGGQIVNTGMIAGSNASAIAANAADVSLDIVNSGKIKGASDSTVAIGWLSGVTPTTGSLTLELQTGSEIAGLVVANQAGSNDVLRLGGATNASFDAATLGDTAQYRNFDRLDKAGTSTWTLTGSSDYAGATTISEGALVVNGSLAGSAVTVASGARLGGSGAVGAVTLAAGGRIAPGNSIGTLTVNGAYLQNGGAVYEVEVDPGTATSDRVQVNGAATLAAGAAISVINYTGAGFVAGQRYTILTSTGLTGTYGNTDLVLSPFLNLRNSTDATNAYLTVVQTATAGGIGGTPNEAAVGGGIDSLPTGNAVQTGLYNQATLEAARRALGQLAGEIHASARTVLVDESWLLRAAVNDRLRSAFGAVGASPMATLSYGFTADLAPAVKGPMPKPPAAERFAAWGQGYGSWGRIASDGNAASLSRSTGGLLVGADAAVFDNLRLGIVAGYSHSSFEVNRRLASGESDNYHLGLYGGGQFGALSLRAGASYTWHDLSTRRGIVAAGFGDTLRADYDAGTAQAFGELGYRIDLGQSALGQVALEPFAGLAYVVLNSDRFTERGEAAALSAGSGDTSLGYTTLGLRAATTTRLAGMDVTLRGGLGWRHAFGDVDPKTTLAFSGGTPFSIAGLPIAENAALVEAGLDVALGTNVTLGASYTAQLADDAQDHAFKANLAVRF